MNRFIKNFPNIQSFFLMSQDIIKYNASYYYRNNVYKYIHLL